MSGDRTGHVGMTVAGLAAVFVCDLVAPRGYAAFVLYALPVLASGRAWGWLGPTRVAAFSSLLIAVGMLVPTPELGAVEVINRALALALAWVVATIHLRRLGAEATLLHSEARLRQAQQLARLGHWERDLVAERIALSPEAARMFGLAADEVSPAPSRWHAQWLALIHPDDRARAGEVWARALDGSGRYDVEYRIRTSHDGERVIHSLAELTRDRAGRPVKAFGTMQDITAVRRAEEASRVSAAILRAFVDHTTDAFFLLDGDGVIIDVNARACDSLGYAREALLGRRPADLEVSRDAARGGDVATPAAPDPRAASTLEAQYRRADGSTIPVELSLVSFQVEGQRFAVSMARDVTERKRAQASLQLFRALLDHSMDTIEVIEPATGRILDVNAQACRAHGYTRDEYLGLTIVDLSPQVPPARWTAIAADVEREGSIVLQDVHRRKDGSIFPVEVTSSFVRLDRDYLVAVVRDVTARRAAEDALRRSREHLDALIRTIDGVVWESDAGSRRFTFVSPQAQRLLGYPAERWLEDEGFWVEHLHPDDRGHIVAERARAVEERRDHELEYRVIAAGGGTVWLRDLVSVVREGDRVVALRGSWWT